MTNTTDLPLRVARDVFGYEALEVATDCFEYVNENHQWDIFDLNDPAVIVQMIEWLEDKNVYLTTFVAYHKSVKGIFAETLNTETHQQFAQWGETRGEALARLCIEVIDSE